MKSHLLIASGAFLLVGTVAADHLDVYDLDGGEESAFRDLLAAQGKVAKGGWDFDRDADYGVAGFTGPLTSAGAGPVSAGTIDVDNLFMNALNNVDNNLVAVGPSAGFGNPSNAILANYFTDVFVITFTSGDKTAAEFNVVSLLGSNTVDITIVDTSGARYTETVAAPTSGTRIGVAVDTSLSTETIASIEIFDAGGGAEGVQGAGLVYVPAPGAIALLGVAGLISRRRRR